jgi:hypothetical protein
MERATGDLVVSSIESDLSEAIEVHGCKHGFG